MIRVPLIMPVTDSVTINIWRDWRKEFYWFRYNFHLQNKYAGWLIIRQPIWVSLRADETVSGPDSFIRCSQSLTTSPISNLGAQQWTEIWWVTEKRHRWRRYLEMQTEVGLPPGWAAEGLFLISEPKRDWGREESMGHPRAAIAQTNLRTRFFQEL